MDLEHAIVPCAGLGTRMTAVRDGEGAFRGVPGAAAALRWYGRVILAPRFFTILEETPFPRGEERDDVPVFQHLAGDEGVKAMVLLHLNPECDRVDLAAECGAGFAGRIVVAEDGMTIHVEGGEPVV